MHAERARPTGSALPDRTRPVTAGEAPDRAAPADWRTIWLVILLISAFALEQGITYPLISLALEGRGVTESLIALNLACFTAGLAVATVSISLISTWLPADRLIFLGLVGSAVCLLLFAAIGNFWFWCANRFLLGVFTSVTYVYAEAWLNTACPDRIRGRVSGLYGAGMSIGFAAGPLAVPLFGTESGLGFVAAAVYVAAVAGVAAIVMPGRRLALEPVPRGGLWRFALAAPIIVAMAFAFGYADTVAISLMPVYFVKVGHTEAFAAITVSMIALPTAFAQPVVGGLLDRYPRRAVAFCCCLLVAAGFLAIPAMESETAILVTYAVIGSATFALYTCALTLLGERYSGGLLVAGSAAISLAYALGGIGSMLSGASMDLAGPIGAPLSVGLLMLVFAALFLAMRRA